MGVMRKDDGNGGLVREGVEKEVVGDCWGWSVWKGTVMVNGWYR